MKLFLHTIRKHNEEYREKDIKSTLMTPLLFELMVTAQNLQCNLKVYGENAQYVHAW